MVLNSASILLGLMGGYLPAISDLMKFCELRLQPGLYQYWLLYEGFTFFSGEYLLFLNAGGRSMQIEYPHINFKEDSFYEGGDAMETNEMIVDGGDYCFLYKSARFGNFCYKLSDLPTGEYFVDLHFAEIVCTNGPEGMRVFDVFAQDEKAGEKFIIVLCILVLFFHQ